MGGEHAFIELAGDRRHDGGRAVSVPNIHSGEPIPAVSLPVRSRSRDSDRRSKFVLFLGMYKNVTWANRLLYVE